MVTKEELKGLLNVLQFYIIAGLALGVVCATIAVNGGIVFTRTTLGIFTTTKAMTAVIVIMLGMVTALMAYAVLLPAELKLVRKRLKPQILRRRLSGRK